MKFQVSFACCSLDLAFFLSRRSVAGGVSLEEMMMSPDITMSRESLDSHKNREQHEDMD